MTAVFQQLVYNLSAKLCCFHSGKDCFCVFRIYTEKYFCHYFLSFLFFVVYVCRQNWLKPAGMKGLTCKSYDRYRPPLCRQSPPCIFSYKPHSLPSANNLPSGLTGQRSSVSFLYRAQRFPVINIFRSGISRPAISRLPPFFTEQTSAFRLR